MTYIQALMNAISEQLKVGTPHNHDIHTGLMNAISEQWKVGTPHNHDIHTGLNERNK